MKRALARIALLPCLALAAVLAPAQPRTGVWLERPTAAVGEPVRINVDFGAAEPWCGLHVNYGDGDVREVIVERFPLALSKRYARFGRFTVLVEGRAVLRGLQSARACAGAPRAVEVTVNEIRPVPPAPGGEAVPGREERDRQERDRRDDEQRREQEQRAQETQRERTRREEEIQREKDQRRQEAAREQRPQEDVERDLGLPRRGTPPPPPPERETSRPSAPATPGASSTPSRRDLTLRAF